MGKAQPAAIALQPKLSKHVTTSVHAALDRLRNHPTHEVANLLSLVTGCVVDADVVVQRHEQRAKQHARLLQLLKHPGITQRTEEWYAARQTMITASDVAQALNCAKFGNQKQFFYKKCGTIEEQGTFNPNLPPLKWGIMFEQVANELYAERNQCAVHEFGLLRHPTVSFLGASPDGISDSGVMLEIKCPWRRKITGEIPDQYYYQIQTQLDVCGLDECDYLECEFAEEPDVDRLWTASPSEARGVFIERTDVGKYIYAPLGLTKGEMVAWSNAATACIGCGWRLHWWRLVTYNCIRVVRDDEFLQTTIDKLTDVWNRVVRYRQDRSAMVTEIGAMEVKSPKQNDEQQSGGGGPEYAFVHEDE